MTARCHIPSAAHVSPARLLARLLATLAVALALAGPVQAGSDTAQAGSFVRAEQLMEEGENEAALALFEQIIAAEPGNIRAREKRVTLLYRLRRFEEVIEAARALDETDPEDSWYPYMQGLALYRLDRGEEALAALDRAVALRPDYGYALRLRGQVHLAAERFALARVDFEAASESFPFDAGLLRLLAQARQGEGDRQGARRAWRLSLVFDPYSQKAKAAIGEEDPPLEPLFSGEDALYRPPRPGLVIRYVHVLMPAEVASEEEVIGDLLNWLRPTPRARPEGLAFLRHEIGATTGPRTMVTMRLEKRDRRGSGIPIPRRARSESLRGLLPLSRRPGTKGPPIRIEYETGDITELWPLEAGRVVEGTGRLFLDCPDPLVLPARLIGCRTPGEALEVGDFTWRMEVLGGERLLLPVGDVDTWRLRYRENATLRIGGRERSRPSEVNWWFSPELGYWLRRTIPLEGKLQTLEAVEIIRP